MGCIKSKPKAKKEEGVSITEGKYGHIETQDNASIKKDGNREKDSGLKNKIHPTPGFDDTQRPFIPQGDNKEKSPVKSHENQIHSYKIEKEIIQDHDYMKEKKKEEVKTAEKVREKDKVKSE